MKNHKETFFFYDDGFVDSLNLRLLDITIFFGSYTSASFSIRSIKTSTACFPISRPCCAIVVIDGDEYSQIKVFPAIVIIIKRQIAKAFQREDLIIYTNPQEFKAFLYAQSLKNTALVFMSSGNYGGLDFEEVKHLVS